MKIEIGDNVYWLIFWIIVAVVICYPSSNKNDKKDPIAERLHEISNTYLSDSQQKAELMKAIILNGTNCQSKSEITLEK